MNIITTTSMPQVASEAELLYAQFELTVLAVVSHALLLTAQRGVASTRCNSRDRWWASLGGAALVTNCFTFDIPDPLWTVSRALLLAGVLCVLYRLGLHARRVLWLQEVSGGRISGFSIRDAGQKPRYEFARQRGAEPERILVWQGPNGEIPLARVP